MKDEIALVDHQVLLNMLMDRINDMLFRLISILHLPTPPGERIWTPSPLEMDIFRISEKVLDDRRRSANAINPWTDSLRRNCSTGKPDGGGSTGNDKHDLLLVSSTSFSSLIVGVCWLRGLSSGVLRRSSVGVRGLSIGSVIDINLLTTARLSGILSFSVVLVRSKLDFWKI